MAGNAAAIITGIILYIIGVVSANIFLEPTQTGFTFHPALELTVLSLAIFVLSSFYYGRISFALLFFAGLFLGQAFAATPLLTITGLMPLLLAILGGKYMGTTAGEDLKGKKNFFQEKDSYMAYIAIIIIFSLIIGFVFGTEIPLPEI